MKKRILVKLIVIVLIMGLFSGSAFKNQTSDDIKMSKKEQIEQLRQDLIDELNGKFNERTSPYTIKEYEEYNKPMNLEGYQLLMHDRLN